MLWVLLAVFRLQVSSRAADGRIPSPKVQSDETFDSPRRGEDLRRGRRLGRFLARRMPSLRGWSLSGQA